LIIRKKEGENSVLKKSIIIKFFESTLSDFEMEAEVFRIFAKTGMGA